MERSLLHAASGVIFSVLLVAPSVGCLKESSRSSSPRSSPTVATAPAKTTAPAPTTAPSLRPAATPATAFRSLPTSEPVTFKEYAEYMANQNAKLAVALRTVSTLSMQAADNPRLLTSRGTWLMDMSDALSSVEIAANNIQKAGAVPPELKSLDDQAKSIGRDLENAASQYFDGLDRLDAALIKSSSATFQSANTKLATYNEELKRFMETHN